MDDYVTSLRLARARPFQRFKLTISNLDYDKKHKSISVVSRADWTEDWLQRLGNPGNVGKFCAERGIMALIFDNNFDSTVTSSSSSQAYQDAVAAVENFLSAQLTTFGAGDVTLKINWRFDTVDANGNSFSPTTLANNIFGNNLVEVSYANIRNALLAHVDSNDSNP